MMNSVRLNRNCVQRYSKSEHQKRSLRSTVMIIMYYLGFERFRFLDLLPFRSGAILLLHQLGAGHALVHLILWPDSHTRAFLRLCHSIALTYNRTKHSVCIIRVLCQREGCSLAQVFQDLQKLVFFRLLLLPPE